MTRAFLALGLALLAACRPEPPPPPDPAVAVFLDPRGLRVVDSTAATSVLVAFGTERGGVAEALAAADVPLAGQNAECAAGPLALAEAGGALTLSFRDSAFAGWSADGRGGPAPFTTATGLGVGSTRAALEGAYRADVDETSLGTEFYTGAPGVPGGLSGLLSGPDPDATVTALWAGTVCAFR